MLMSLAKGWFRVGFVLKFLLDLVCFDMRNCGVFFRIAEVNMVIYFFNQLYTNYYRFLPQFSLLGDPLKVLI